MKKIKKSSLRLKEFSQLFSSAKNKEKLRGEKEELITRFFAYSDEYQNFGHSVKGFLDEYIMGQSKIFGEQTEQIKYDEFIRMLNFIEQYIPNGFRKTEGSEELVGSWRKILFGSRR